VSDEPLYDTIAPKLVDLAVARCGGDACKKVRIWTVCVVLQVGAMRGMRSGEDGGMGSDGSWMEAMQEAAGDSEVSW
jgi:hypothetical protein